MRWLATVGLIALLVASRAFAQEGDERPGLSLRTQLVIQCEGTACDRLQERIVEAVRVKDRVLLVSTDPFYRVHLLLMEARSPAGQSFGYVGSMVVTRWQGRVTRELVGVAVGQIARGTPASSRTMDYDWAQLIGDDLMRQEHHVLLIDPDPVALGERFVAELERQLYEPARQRWDRLMDALQRPR